MRDIYFTCKPRLVLPITPDEVEEILSVVNPVIDSGADEMYHYRLFETEGVDRYTTAFTWVDGHKGRIVRIRKSPFENVCIPSFHTYGAPSLFKPSLAECCAAIKHFLPTWRDGARFFSVGDGSMGPESCLEGGFHIAKLILFGEEAPKNTEDQADG